MKTTVEPDTVLSSEAAHRAPRLYCRRVQLTLEDLAEHTDAAASALSASGVRPGDLVRLDMDDSAEALVCFFALAALDTRMILGNQGPSSGEEEEKLILAPHIRKPSPLHRGLREIVSLPPGPSERLRSAGAEHTRALNLDDVLPEPWLSRADGLILMTSGSSGSPKRVPRQPRSFMDNLRHSQRILKYRPDDVLMPIAPLNHQYGLSVVLHALLVGADIIIGSPWRISESIRLGRRHGATVVEATPEVYLRTVDFVVGGKIDKEAFASWRQAGVGGSPTDASTLALVREALGLSLCDGYGSTEAGNIALADPDDPEGGLVPLDCFTITVNDDAGRARPPGELGLLALHNTETGHSWESGDLASFKDGRLLVAGRANAVHRRGLVVYPAAIEERLRAQGIPALVTSYGSTRGTRIAAIVEDRFRRGRRHWWNRILGVEDLAELPDSLLIVDRIPRLDQGKPDLCRLRNALTASEAPAGARETALAATARFLRGHRQETVDLLSAYQTREASEIEVDGALAALDSAAVEVALENPHPLKRSWVYMPSNVVLYSYVLYGLVPALWTDEILLRPSSRARELAEEIHAFLAPVHGLNVNLAPCSQTEFAALRTGTPGLIVFTGRHENAAQLAAGLEPGQVMAFSGQGTNPVVVGPEADIGTAAADTARIRLLNGGQDCFGPDLVFVHEDRSSEFLEELSEQIVERAEAVATAPVLDEETARALLGDLWDARERILTGGVVRLPEGLFDPTLRVWQAHERPMVTEVFAPVFNVVVYSDEEDITSLLSEEHYRLRWMGASLYGVSRQLSAWFAARMTTSLGRSLVDADDPRLPMGGLGPHSSAVHTVGVEDPQPVLLSRVASEYGHLMAEPARAEHTQREGRP